MNNTLAQARRMMTEDSNVLRKAIADLGPDALTAHHLVDGRPLGDACDSLRDLVAHHTMWLEIDLAVLFEAQAGRKHWSTTTRWSQRPVGQRLNESGVARANRSPTPPCTSTASLHDTMTR